MLVLRAGRLALVAVVAATAIGAAACGGRAAALAPAPPAATPTVDAYLVDAHGPVAGVTVSVVALPDGHCPCATALDTTGYSNEMPSCACPEALSKWEARLAACGGVSPIVDSAVTDSRGKATLRRGPGGTGIEAARGAGIQWMPWPAHAASSAISVELAPSIIPTIRIANTGSSAVVAGVLFDDGHCIPLDRRGDSWVPRSPLPRLEQNGGTLVIQSTGYATVVYSLFDEDDVDITLHRDLPVNGECEGPIVRLDNPFQHMVQKLDKPSTSFSFSGALDLESTVSCWSDAETEDDEWTFHPGEGLAEGVNVYSSPSSCEEVKIVDDNGHPVEGASVSLMHDEGGGFSEGTGGETDKHGIACFDDLWEGARLEVDAPGHLGGSCAGHVERRLTRQSLATRPVVVRVHIQKLPMSTVHGRVVTAEGVPVAGASVGAADLEPSATPDCGSSSGDGTTTASDGTFTLPPLPRGKMTLGTHHDWYVDRELAIVNDGTPHDIVVQRGGRWTGRVLDPAGKPITSCSIYLTLAGGRSLSSKCSPTGFSFGTIVAGDAKVVVHLDHHALGTVRTLTRTVHFDQSDERAERAEHAEHREDLAFPRGKDISGRVVDPHGNGIAGARVTALPKGEANDTSRYQEHEIMVEADARGAFTFRDLAPGTWTLRGNIRDTRHASKDLDVPAGTTDVTFVVPAP